MNAILPATLDLTMFRPVGKFSFSFSKKTYTTNTGATVLYLGECNTTHLPFTLDNEAMNVFSLMMVNEHTDVFFDGMHCYTTGNNSLVMIKHPLISEWIKKNF